MLIKTLKVQTMGDTKLNEKLIKHFSEKELEFAIVGSNIYVNSCSYLDIPGEFASMSHLMKFDTEHYNNGAGWDFIHEQRSYIQDFYTLVDVISFEKEDGDMIFYRRISKAPKIEGLAMEVK